MSTSVFTRAANVAQKGTVLGLMSFFGFQIYQIGRNVQSGRVDHPVMESTYFEDVASKVREEYATKDGKIDTRDWYEEDDASYLKDQVRPNITQPQFRKNYEEQRKQV